MKAGTLLPALLLAACCAASQEPAARQLVGAVSDFLPASAELVVRPDHGETVRVRITPSTVLQRVEPGEKDLSRAVPLAVSDIAVGDRVLVTLLTGGEARRLVLMPAADIARKQAFDRLDWQRRGVFGVVTSKTDSSITLRVRSFASEAAATVVVDPRTGFRRYAPDSVRFADALPSSLSEVQPGDQLRARGRKNESGTRVEAEEIVFGSFVTRAGVISAVDAATQTLTLKDSGNKKPFVVKLTADTQVKSMPPAAADPMQHPAAAGMPGSGPPFGPAGGMGRAGGPGFDVAQMLERLPAAHLSDLKPGMTVVVSSTRSANSSQMTAITLVANAEMLVEMARRSAQAKGNDAGVSLSGGGFGGLDLPGMIN